MTSLSDLVKNLTPTEKSEVVIVVFVADFSQSYRQKVSEDVKMTYPKEVNEGMLQIIVAPREFYPNMETLPPLYGDKPDRVQWRSKQALDYSFLYFYCANISKYYIQLEDDVLVEPGYLQSLKDFIEIQDPGWSTLEFGATGFIGMMYRGEHLFNLARFSRHLFWTMPIDWIFRVYNEIFLNGNSDRYKRTPPIFKHIGVFSSLEGQTRGLEDFANSSDKDEILIRKFQIGPNPPANVTTSIAEYVLPNSIDHAYNLRGFYWGKAVQIGDSIDIVLINAVKLSRIVFASGSTTYPQDSFKDTELLVGTESHGGCTDFKSVKSFVDISVVDVTFGSELDYPVKCIRLQIRAARGASNGIINWLLITEIAVIPKFTA